MNVRSFKLSDYRKITELLQEVLTEQCYEDTIEAFGRQLSWDSDLVMVAETEEEDVIGVIIGTIDHNKGYYYRIAIAESHQQLDVGQLLVQSLKQRFEQRKVSKILITADEHNEQVLPLFESLGYVAADFFRSFQKLSIVTG